MPTYETELLNRVVALELEAMASINVRCDAKGFFYWTQESFPYFTNRIASNGVADDGSEVFDINRPLVIMRLIVGHITEGYKGEPESKLYEWGPIVKAYIQNRSDFLECANAPYNTRMDGLRYCKVIDNGGFRIFEDSGLGTKQVGRELQLQCEFVEVLEQVYD